MKIKLRSELTPGQRVKCKDEWDEDWIFGTVLSNDSEEAEIKWEDCSEPIRYNQDDISFEGIYQA